MLPSKHLTLRIAFYLYSGVWLTRSQDFSKSNSLYPLLPIILLIFLLSQGSREGDVHLCFRSSSTKQNDEFNDYKTFFDFLKICLIVCKMHIYDRIPVYETVMQVLSLLKWEVYRNYLRQLFREMITWNVKLSSFPDYIKL